MQEVKFERVARHISMQSLSDALFAGFTAGPCLSHADFQAISNHVSTVIKEAIGKSNAPPDSFIFVNLDLSPSRLVNFLTTRSEKDLPFQIGGNIAPAICNRQAIEVLWLHESNAHELCPEDTRDALRNMTRDLAESVAVSLPDYRILFADRWITSGIASLTGPYMLKVLNHESWKEAWDALDLLFSLKERSPYLSYAMPYRALDPSVCSAVIIEQRLSILPLTEAIQSRTAPELLQYLAHVAHAAQFLIENNLRLSDICPENIFIDLDRNVGILRDYDGLRLANAEGIYIHRRGNYPPGRPFLHGPISEADMVHELGSSINFVLRRSKEKFESLSLMVSQMLSLNPRNRPLMREVVANLRSLA